MRTLNIQEYTLVDLSLKWTMVFVLNKGAIKITRKILDADKEYEDGFIR
jgi:hypothetical protein